MLFAHGDVKLKEFEELLNVLLVRLGSNLYGENNTEDSLHLSDWSIRTVLFILVGPLFVKNDLTQDERDVLNTHGVPFEIQDEIYQPLCVFIRENENKMFDFIKCYEQYMTFFRK